MRAPVSTESRALHAHALATAAGFQARTLYADPFVLKSYISPTRRNNAVLSIYIEGDGLAWISSDMPSANPTPVNPVALKMALHDQGTVAYLARPCQFVFDKQCRPAYWTNLRFSSDVVNAMNHAVSSLKKYYHAKRIILVGYSGGGTIAALIAARRHDVVKLITVAAVLDVRQWVSQESLTPLYGSLDPADEWEKLVSIPQTHWVGGRDAVVPLDVAFAFANRFPMGKNPEVKVVPTFDHVCCWATEFRV